MAGRGGQRKRARAKQEAQAQAEPQAPSAGAVVFPDLFLTDLHALVESWRCTARSGVDCAQQLEAVLKVHGVSA